MVQRFRLARRAFAFALTAALFSATAILSPSANAQSYSCFPSCSPNDGRFLSLASTGLDAFAGNNITIGIGLAPNATQLVVEIFDGETGTNWDRGTMPLEYKLYADPQGDGTDATLIATYNGMSMTDNGWFAISHAVSTSAQASNGNYVYYMNIEMPAPAAGTTATSTSSFKIRVVNGTITVRSHQSFSIQAPAFTSSDARTLYPNWDAYPGTDLNRYANSKYDGNWNIYLDVLTPSTDLTIWDGDMDRGSFDGTNTDTDDADTPPTPPTWGTNANPEAAVAASPFDDNASPVNRRAPAVRYELYFPDQTTMFSNENPSGSVEWEQFRISTEPFDRAIMDAHADEIPAGIYTLRVNGMDLLNVNAWRFFNNVVSQPSTSNVEIIGVNPEGLPVAPIRAIETVNGSISGSIYYDGDQDGVQDPGEPGIPSVTVTAHKLNADGTVASSSSLSNIDGNYTFSKLGACQYRISVDPNSLHSDVVPTYDVDGVETPGCAVLAVSANDPNQVGTFGFKRASTVGTGTRGYWTNHEENWPVEELEIGGCMRTKSQLLRILQRATKGDKSYSMAAQLIATKLNLLMGAASDCICADVATADAWLAAHPLDLGKTSTADWATGEPTHNRLDDYNNGRLCAPHMN